MLKPTTRKITRRQFLGMTAATGMAFGLGGLLGACKPAAPKEQKLLHWSMFSEGEPLQQYIAKKISEFQAAHPGLTIEAKWAGREVLLQLRTAILAGTVPDFVDHSTAELTAALVKEGRAYPFDEALETKNYEGDAKWRDTFIKSVLEQGMYEGKVYIIPRETYTSGYFYNIDMFEKLGLDIPETWDKLMNVCETLKANGIAPISLDNFSGYVCWPFSWCAIRILGADALYNATLDKTGEAWKDPGFLKAAEMAQTFASKGYYQEGYEGSVWPASQLLWVQGKTGLLFCGSWIPTEMAPEMPAGFKTEIFPFPKIEGGKGNDVAEAWSNGWVILKDAPNKEMAIEFVKFASSKEFENGVAKLGSPIPLKGGEMPEGTKGQAKMLEEAKRVVPKFDGIEAYRAEFMKAVWWVHTDALMFLKETPKQFIEGLVKDSKAWHEKQG